MIDNFYITKKPAFVWIAGFGDADLMRSQDLRTGRIIARAFASGAG
jgi:hypothetical protein